MWLVWSLAGAALLLSIVRGAALRETTVAPLCPAGPAWHSGGFEPDAVYPATDLAGLPRAVRRIGSWIGGDGWRGDAATVWAPVSGPVAVYVAGYPQHPGCSLRAEFRSASGVLSSTVCPLADPRESWQVWRLTPPPGAAEIRIVAHDAASDNSGWLAFSEPVAARSSWLVALFMAAQTFTTVALAFTLVWGPGLLWMSRRLADELGTLALLAAGPLLLVLLALVIWIGDAAASPHRLAFALTAGTWSLLGWRLYRRPPDLRPSVAAVLAVSLILVVATTAKAAYSGGPDGELFGGTISRTLEASDRSDARISFHVVQAVARHLAPADPATERYFAPWTFFSRGPLAGLDAVPVSLAISARPPLSMPDQPWTPFDATGFAAYRIVLMTLASMVVFALFAVLRAFVDETAAATGAALLALCPFTVHEVLFTWPKWEATVFVLAAFLLVHRRRPLLAGAVLGLGTLYHPLAGLWVPWLAVWAAARESSTPARIAAAARCAAAACVVAAAWMLAGKLTPHLPGSYHAGEAGFFAYFKLAEYAPATWASWWKSRAMNVGNTFVPLWLYAKHADRLGLAPAGAGSAVKFAFSWWNTLPFGMGLLLWGTSLMALAGALRRYAFAIVVLIVGPTLLLIAYWGAFASGLMRECGHPLLVAIVGLTVVVLARHPRRLSRLLAHPAFPWLQLPETLLMLWLTTLVNPRASSAAFRDFDAFYLCVSIAALAAVAWIGSRGIRSVSEASERRERATRTERAGEAARERACRGV